MSTEVFLVVVAPLDSAVASLNFEQMFFILSSGLEWINILFMALFPLALQSSQF